MAFSHLRQLYHFKHMGKSGQQLVRNYEVRNSDEFHENQWLRFKSFTIIRKG